MTISYRWKKSGKNLLGNGVYFKGLAITAGIEKSGKTGDFVIWVLTK